MLIRPAAVAGLFYPAQAAQLCADVDRYLGAAAKSDVVPKAAIAPHAGYIYSGPIAGSVYSRIALLRGKIKRVAILGPAHRVPISGLALSSAEAFATPLGEVELDAAASENLQKLSQVNICDEAHALEHSLEVQLPFLQVTLGQFKLIPLVAGDVATDAVAEVIEALWDDGQQTLVIVSSDLSHFLDSDQARRLDRQTADAIEGLHPEQISAHQACGGMLIRGLLRVAASHQLQPKTIDLRNSGDTAGDRSRVVGYGAFVL